MPTDTRRIKKRLLRDDQFTEAQADALLDALFVAEDDVITRAPLEHALRKQTLPIVGINAAVVAIFNSALYAALALL